MTTFRAFARPASLIVFGLGIVHALALVLSDRAYIDDLSRAIQGQAYYANGRPVTAITFQLLNLGQRIVDLSPLPQLGGIALVCLCCLMFVRMLTETGIPERTSALIASLFLLHPFLLQNLAYQFDALTMALAVFCAVLAGALRVSAKSHWLFATAASLTFLLLCIYQPAVNVAAAVALIGAVLALERGNSARSVIIELASRAAGILVAVVIYQLTIARLMTGGNYASSHGGSVPFNLSGLRMIVRNLLDAGELIAISLTPTQLFVALSLLVIAQGGATFAALRLFRRSSGWATLGGVLVLSSPLDLLFLTMGSSAFLSHPVLQPRVFLAFGCLLVLGGYFIYQLIAGYFPFGSERGRAVAKIVATALIGVPLLFSIDVAFAFSNAMQGQKELDQTIAIEVGRGWPITDEGVQTQLVATIGTSPTHIRVTAAAKAFPILSLLVRRNFDLPSFGPALLRFYDLPVRRPNAGQRKRMIAEAQGIKDVFQSRYFSLRKVRGGLVIVFR